ncbi:MAG: threonylcarbamoyl-AMP synthase [Lachnospiraceae bacterium]|nr:threonylcarbamoyl-AMP synthase [Lachnospiraceae bacterium]
MKTVLLSTGDENLVAAGRVLRDGGIVAFPTDTVYGLGAIYRDEKAVAKIFDAKGRDEGKPLSILVSNIDQVNLLADFGSGEMAEKAGRLMKKYWPGALTLIFKKKPGIPDNVTAGGETIGIRMPDLDVTLKIIEAAGLPLAAPSANTSGKRSSVTAEDVSEDLDGKIDMIIDGGACKVGLASTVVDMTGDRPKILREGVITQEMIDEA